MTLRSKTFSKTHFRIIHQVNLQFGKNSFIKKKIAKNENIRNVNVYLAIKDYFKTESKNEILY